MSFAHGLRPEFRFPNGSCGQLPVNCKTLISAVTCCHIYSCVNQQFLAEF